MERGGERGRERGGERGGVRERGRERDKRGAPAGVSFSRFCFSELDCHASRADGFSDCWILRTVSYVLRASFPPPISMFAHLTHVDRDGRRQLFEDTDAGRDVLRRGRGQRRCRRQKTSGVIVRRRHQGLDGGERARLRGPSHARCGPVGTSHMPRQGGGGFAGRESAELGHGKGRRSFALEMSSF